MTRHATKLEKQHFVSKFFAFSLLCWSVQLLLVIWVVGHVQFVGKLFSTFSRQLPICVFRGKEKLPRNFLVSTFRKAYVPLLVTFWVTWLPHGNRELRRTHWVASGSQGRVLVLVSLTQWTTGCGVREDFGDWFCHHSVLSCGFSRNIYLNFCSLAASMRHLLMKNRLSVPFSRWSDS